MYPVLICRSSSLNTHNFAAALKDLDNFGSKNHNCSLAVNITAESLCGLCSSTWTLAQNRSPP